MRNSNKMKTVLLKLFVVALLFSALYCSRFSRVKKTLSKDTSSWSMSTGGNDWGDGQVVFLDRHQVYCNSTEVMQGWHFYRPTTTTIAYKYKCKKVENPGNMTEYETSFDIYGSGDGTNYLDRHRPSCPDGSALNGFNLARQGSSKIAIHYKCLGVKLNNCSSITTSETAAKDPSDTNYPNDYLDRQTIEVADDEAITGYQLHTRYPTDNAYYSYEVLFCKMPVKVTGSLNSIQDKASNQVKNVKVTFTSADGKVYNLTVKDNSYEVYLNKGNYTLTVSENVVLS